jgi:galactonate dehydratase
MSRNDFIRRITLLVTAVSAKTKWAFVEVEVTSGAVGTGEATLHGQEIAQNALAEEMRRIGSYLIGKAAVPESLYGRFELTELPTAAIVSALDQALTDLAAQRRGQSLCEFLGQKRTEVDAYANINRRTEPRTPEAFAESAKLALAAGFRAVKLAPFDEVTPATASLAQAAKGVERISQVRDILPDNAGLYVDCHWRFTPRVAADMVAPLRECGVSWYECPIAETKEHVVELRRLRHLANDAGMVLAGLEQGIGTHAFETFARAGAYDVMMPDIKYIGGIEVMLRTGEILSHYGATLSPHNPSGPICHAASLAVCGALEHVGILEMQFNETHHFDRLVGGELPAPVAGQIRIPGGLGLGVLLDRQALAELPGDVVVID